MKKKLDCGFNSQILPKESKKGFKMLAGINRAIAGSQVTVLAKSIETMGVIRPIVIAYIDFITGVLEPYIIDGQHLYHALTRLMMDYPYTVIKIKDKEDLVHKIALLNSSSKSWCMQDYVTAWASLIPDYVTLNKYAHTYDFELSLVAAILSDNTFYTGTVINKKIKSGQFRITNEDKAIEILNNLTDILKIIPRMTRFENKYLCGEYLNYVSSVSKYNHKQFLTLLAKNKEKLILSTQEKGLLSEMFTKLK